MTYKLGSLFDGSGGFPLAGSLCGIEPVWAAEVEPYPIAVTRSRFPNMKHLGDISKINGAEVEPVDIITFGSPCQDLSVAGKRAGLKHEANGDEETTRSGLFMEAVRIIREMREATNGAYPRFALWENVPGAFSSNKGEDFRIVLEELIKIVEPGATMPPVPKNGWPYADSYCGAGWSLAYRVFDAQHWGVPQRRRRIHLVLDLTAECAREVSFEREGVRGYFETGRTPGKETARNAEGGTGTADCGECVGRVMGSAGFNYLQGSKARTIGFETEKAGTLRAGQFGDAVLVKMEVEGFDMYNQQSTGDKSRTLKTPIGGDDLPVVCYSVENHPADSRVNIDDSGKVQTLTSRMCTGGGNVPMVMEPVPPAVRYIVRRLTPTECARLQGFPDKWGHPDVKEDFTDEEYRFWMEVRNTHATVIGGKEAKDYTKAQMLTWYNKLHTDSAEYKMWGNGIALPPALYLLQGMADVLNREPKVVAEKENEPAVEQKRKATVRKTVTTEEKLAYKQLLRNRKHLTTQQYRTIKGQIRSGDILGAMNGLVTITRRNFQC